MQQFWCKPQAFNLNPLVFSGTVLPAATPFTAYTQNISAQAHGGTPPYTFSLLSSAPPGDVWFVSAAGVITGTPGSNTFDRITNTGAFRITNTGANRVT